MAANKTWGFVHVVSPISAFRNALPLGSMAKDRRPTIFHASHFSLVAVCLTAGLLAFIALEAFDDDLDFWPSGAENIIGALHQEPVIGGRTPQIFSPLLPKQDLVLAARPQTAVCHRACRAIALESPSRGAHLALRHRARNAIAPNDPSICIACDMAECRGRLPLDGPPAVSHFFL